MRTCSRAWLPQRKSPSSHQKRSLPGVPSQHQLTPSWRKLPWIWPWSLLQRRGPWTSSLVGRKCYIPPDQWLPLGRFPFCQEAQDEGLIARVWGKGWFKSLELRNRVCWLPSQNALAYQRVWDHPMSNTATWFCWGDCVSAEESATRRGFWPGCIEDGSAIRAYCSDHECQLCCKRWGDRGNLHGTPWPLWGGGWPSVALNRRPQPRGLKYRMAQTRSNQITTFGWWGELTTTFEQVSELISAFGHMSLSMTAFGQRESVMSIGQ